MRVWLQVRNTAGPRLRELGRHGAPEARRRMVEDGMRTALARVIDRSPVRTGRSRRGWGAALMQVGGAAGGGAAFLASGASFSPGGEGLAQQEHDAESTVIRGVNTVPYVPFLEYGTSRMAPYAMVRQALAEVRQIIGRMFRLFL